MICHHQVVQTQIINGKKYMFLRPCGQCLNCRINDIRSWFVRSHFELKKPERPFQYFITLTYNDESLPEDGQCHKEELKKFLNNLNTSFGLKMRYYACSDYGSINNRAHYHMILLSTKKVYASQVERIWKKGFVYVKPLNVHNMKYTLRYTVKKRPIPEGDKAFFRMVSLGWGNNVKDYYTEGQEFFIIDGKKYGISSYLRGKLGLPKNPVDKTQYFDRLVMDPFYKDRTGDFDTYVEDVNKWHQVLRRMK